MIKPIISVVMSVYNGEYYLQKTIESVLNQTYADFEFIVVDDGSTDNTREILETYTDNRLIVMHKDNSGLTKSLNLALARSTGKYIARQDVGDISKPDRFSKQLKFMETNPGVGLVAADTEFVNECGDRLWVSCAPIANDALQEGLLQICQFSHPSVFIRKTALESVGNYREFFTYAQDYDLWLRIAEKYELANINEILITCIETNKGISHKKVFVQTLYAGLAAKLAIQRRSIGYDDLEKGKAPIFPSVESLSEPLQQKLLNSIIQYPDSFSEEHIGFEYRSDIGYLRQRAANLQADTNSNNIKNYIDNAVRNASSNPLKNLLKKLKSLYVR